MGSYGDNFCDAIEELHSTFAAAGAKMLGAVDSGGYQHSESKSEADGKFLGMPCDQDNEDDMTEGRVKAWVSQLKGEGMPLMWFPRPCVLWHALAFGKRKLYRRRASFHNAAL